MMDYNQPDVHLLHGCCQEASRADMVAMNLQSLRHSLPLDAQVINYPHITALVEEVMSTARGLRDLADRSQVHHARVPIMLNYLTLVLPCLHKTLKDMTGFYEDKSLGREMRWRKMYHRMKDEVELPLVQRFAVYNQFLTLLKQLLTRAVEFDLNLLETLRGRISQFRDARKIGAPSQQVGPLVRPDSMAMILPVMEDPRAHWAEQIFSLPLPSRTAFKHPEQSISWGPFEPWGPNLNIPRESQVLFRRPFDNDKLSIIAYINLINRVPYLLIRTHHMGKPWFALRGTHELCIKRDESALVLRRWSYSAQTSKKWASLHFQTWEEMVLFHCTFVSLKARDALTYELDPADYKLSGENKLFQARILDDDRKHLLAVFEDRETQGLRLHAAMCEGTLQRCPVWTAFVTHQSASPTWLQTRSRTRVWLRDVQLYVFSNRYRQQSQRRSSAGGVFEIQFASEEAARRFKEVFYPTASTTTGTAEAENEDGNGHEAEGTPGGPPREILAEGDPDELADEEEGEEKEEKEEKEDKEGEGEDGPKNRRDEGGIPPSRPPLEPIVEESEAGSEDAEAASVPSKRSLNAMVEEVEDDGEEDTYTENSKEV